MTPEAYPPARRLEGVFTARYQDARHALVQPVRATLGAPKFMPGLPEVPFCYCPRDLFHEYNRGEFKARWWPRLDRHGVPKIRQAIDAVRTASDRPIALCCFCDVTGPGEWCHRLVFSEWWQDRTGEMIPELSLLGVEELRALWPQQAEKLAGPPAPMQGGLF